MVEYYQDGRWCDVNRKSRMDDEFSIKRDKEYTRWTFTMVTKIKFMTVAKRKYRRDQYQPDDKNHSAIIMFYKYLKHCLNSDLPDPFFIRNDFSIAWSFFTAGFLATTGSDIPTMGIFLVMLFGRSILNYKSTRFRDKSVNSTTA